MKLLILFLFTLIFFQCQYSFAEQEHVSPVKIGAILHLTGDLAMQGNAFKEGIELRADSINRDGGINGRSLEIVFENTNFDSAETYRAAHKLIHIDKVSAVLISTFHETKAVSHLFEKAKIPLICLWDSTPELEEMGSYLFSIGTWLPATGETTARFARGQLKADKAAVITTNREWSLRVGSDFSRIFQSLGGTVVFQDSYNPGETNFRNLFLKMKGKSPQVLYAPVDDNLGAFFKQLKESRVSVHVIQSDNLNDEWLNTLSDYVEGVYQSHSMEPESESAKNMILEYRQKYGKEPSQLLFQGWGYDGIGIISNAIRISGESPEEIMNGLYLVEEYPGVVGNISISEKGSHKLGVEMFQVRNGKFVKVSDE
jgi:branched-chain amino acid transport system substrate-binding protein